MLRVEKPGLILIRGKTGVRDRFDSCGIYRGTKSRSSQTDTYLLGEYGGLRI